MDPTQSATICEISGDIRIGIPQCRAEFGEVELGAPDFRDGVAQISGREKS